VLLSVLAMFSKFFDQKIAGGEKTQQKKSSKKVVGPKGKGPKSTDTSTSSKRQDPKAKKSKSPDASKKRQQSASHNKKDMTHPRKRRRHDRDERNGGPRKFQRKVKPSPEVLELSRRLMELSRQKKLEDALNLYWDESNNPLRDAHHACIIVDCCARCGDISRAQTVLDAIPKEDKTVELQTALIKGYAHAGDIHSAMDVFRSLYPNGQGESKQTPNVRTLNTLLRGCLWTAAMEKPDTGIAGGVVSSEEAWNIHTKCCGEVAPPDASSYEASVTLLCQAFRVEDAKARIEQFEEQFSVHFKGKASIKIGDADQSVLETLAAAYLCLGRCYAMLKDHDNLWQAAQRSLRSIEASRRLLAALKVQPQGKSNEKKDHARGGKRGWRKKDGGEDKDERRNASNLTYRDHRLSEMETEVKALLKLRATKAHPPTRAEAAEHLSSYFMSKLFYFGGGGTTELTQQPIGNRNKPRKPPVCSPDRLLLPKSLSFGLTELSGIVEKPKSSSPSKESEKHKQFFDSHGRLKPELLFGRDLSKAPLDIELGAGFGDWVVRQAGCHQERNHVAVELRSDRVYQIVARAVLSGNQPSQNLCVVGSEAGSFLRDRVEPKSVSNIFVNYPEPPTQMFGDDRVELEKVESGTVEPAHMLSYSTLKLAFQCLRPGGRITVVTDNKWYAKLVCVTCVRLARQIKGVHVPKASEFRGLREIERFNHGIRLFQGQPNNSIGHAETEGGGSYFDRLWRAGTSNYAQKTTRFVVLVSRK